MSLAAIHRRIISGKAGLWTMPLRCLLVLLSKAYRMIIDVRNNRFDRGRGTVRISVPVISVGNVTVGGTGKTPVVIDIVDRLRARGLKPAVVARGYGASNKQSGDEERLIRNRACDVAYVADANRWRGASQAIQQGADVIVLDDAFQHRALARDLDIVLIDATCPFGYEHLLPRGLLREPVQNLRRADLFIVTRAADVTEEVLADIHARLQDVNPKVSVISCWHKPQSIIDLEGECLSEHPSAFLANKKVFAFSALANPLAFERTLEALGATVAKVRRWPDHHSYRPRDIRPLFDELRRSELDLLVTSEKDAVKLTDLDDTMRRSIAVLTIAIDFVGEDAKIIESLLDRTLHQSKSE